MKKILLLLTLICFTSFAQNPNPNRFGISTKFVQPDTLSTTQRTALTPKLGTLIYHKDTGVSQWEEWDGDSWEELGGDGAVESVQGYIGVVVLDADDIDDTSTTNKFVTSTEKGLIATALQDIPNLQEVLEEGNKVFSPDSLSYAQYDIKDGMLGGVTEHFKSDTPNYLARRVIRPQTQSLTVSDGGYHSAFEMQPNRLELRRSNFSTSKTVIVKIGDPNSEYGTLFLNTPSNAVYGSEYTIPLSVNGVYADSDGNIEVEAAGGATNAENVIVSPSIGGNTDAYAVMDDHEDRTVFLETQIAILTPTFTTTAPSQVISLTKIGGTFYTTPEYQDTYTLTGSIDGAFAELAIDTTGETVFPAVTGATLWDGASFEADEDFSMVVRDIDGTRVYFFLKR